MRNPLEFCWVALGGGEAVADDAGFDEVGTAAEAVDDGGA